MHLYVAPPGAVMYDPHSCGMVVTIPRYHSFLFGVLYITCVPYGKKLLVTSTWIVLIGLTASVCGLLFVPFLTCILAACGIGRLDLLCWYTIAPLGIASHCQVGCSCITSGQNENICLSLWLLANKLFTSCTYFLAFHLIGNSVLSL